MIFDPRVKLVSLLWGRGMHIFFRKALDQMWGTKVFLGLRSDLTSLPPIRPAKVQITMKPCDGTNFSGFLDEFNRVSGLDYLNAILRQAMYCAGVTTLYVAPGPDGSPAYAQWLVTARDAHFLHSHQPGRYPMLMPDEVLLEGAYTFACYRRTGVMSNGMAQLLRIAQAKGARSAITYVASDNIPALLGCARVGFTLDHVRINTRRLFFRQSVVRTTDECMRRVWTTATNQDKLPHVSSPLSSESMRRLT